jgi:hypothetical protein
MVIDALRGVIYHAHGSRRRAEVGQAVRGIVGIQLSDTGNEIGDGS